MQRDFFFKWLKDANLQAGTSKHDVPVLKFD